MDSTGFRGMGGVRTLSGGGSGVLVRRRESLAAQLDDKLDSLN